MFTGCGTALVTPFREDLSVDEHALRALVERQIKAGIDFLVPCGTTGESPTLEQAEHLRVCEITLEQANGRVPVLAGAGGYNTQHVIHMIRDLEKIGVTGVLSVTPYYNKPNQEGVYQHYKAIAEATDLPIIVYSVQTRTLVNVEPATVARLSQLKNIVGIKEASGSVSQMSSILALVPDSFMVLSGDDAVALPLIALGGKGVISVVSNEIPGEFTQLTRAAMKGDFAQARAFQRKYQSLMEVNFVEVSPGPVKYALARMGLLEPIWRLPMVPPSAASKKKVDEVLQASGLLSAAGARV